MWGQTLSPSRILHPTPPPPPPPRHPINVSPYPLGLFYDIKKLETFSKVPPSTHEKILGSHLVLDAKKR